MFYNTSTYLTCIVFYSYIYTIIKNKETMTYQLVTNVPDYITDCDTIHEMVMNILEKITPESFKYSDNLEDKMWACIYSRILKGYTEDKIKKDIRQLVKRNIGSFYEDMTFSRIYRRIRKSVSDWENK